MTLKKLLEGAGVLKINADLEKEVSGLKINSKEVENGDIFFCMKGIKDDGNRYLPQIYCDFIAVTEDEPSVDVQYVIVEDVRKAYSIISQNYFQRPLEGMKFVAVVGTNGKTSTAHYISSLLSYSGMKTGLIGTEGHFILGEKVGASLTTPDPYELNELLFKMRSKGVEVVVSEVSAHAIYLEKLYGIVADVSVLTNISQDHLDYFKDFDTYRDVKLSYFQSAYTKSAIINIDDACGRMLAEKLEGGGLPFVTFGLTNPADCFAIDIRENIDGIKFIANLCDEIVEVKSGLFGRFNVYNMLAALSVGHVLGLSADALTHASKKVRGVKGRFSLLQNDKGLIIIDYAHTPDGLQNLLSTARTLTKSRLITVFGCGGERDTGKRKIMGEVASKYSDYVVITSDNPRFEDPETIVADIEKGMSAVPYKSIVDRTDAIAFALSEMLEGDTIVIAGKGSENYLEIRGKKIPYSDFDTAKRWGRAK